MRGHAAMRKIILRCVLAVKVKVHFVPFKAVKAYGRSGDIAPFILNLGTRRR